MSLDLQNLGVSDPFANDTTKAGGVGGNASTHLIREPQPQDPERGFNCDTVWTMLHVKLPVAQQWIGTCVRLLVCIGSLVSERVTRLPVALCAFCGCRYKKSAAKWPQECDDRAGSAQGLRLEEDGSSP